MEHKRLLRSFAIAVIGGLTLAGAAAPAFTGKLQWRNVGPWIGGRVVAVAGAPGRANLFYMGAVDGGIWKSTDYGLSWQNISDGKLPSGSNSIGAIAVAPSNTRIIYAGTGESDIRGNVITGDGMYKSTDAGESWQYAGLRDTHTISAIVVDPRDPNTLYASSMGHVFKANEQRGVFKSSDGGKSWRRVFFVNGDTGAIGLVLDAKHPDVLYAAMWQAYRRPWALSSGGPGSGLYRSTDGGAHWTNLSHRPGFPGGLLGRIGVSIAASDPRVVYAIVQAQGGGVFRSDDGGNSWRLTNDEWKLRQRAFYYMSVYADPTNANTLYAPQVDALWVSRDGGKTFTRLRTPHGDNHIVWIDPKDPRILLEGNDGGATISTNGGETWSQEHNQPTGQFYHISLDGQFPFHIYGAQQDSSSVEGPSAAARGSVTIDQWQNVAYGESTFVAPQPDDPAVTYGSGYFSIFLRYESLTNQYESVSPWPYYQEGAASEELRYRFGWTHPILFSPANPKQLLVGAQYVLSSDDYGQSWHAISPDLTRNDPRSETPSGGPIDLDQSSAEVFPGIASLAVSPLDAQLLWAGSDDGLVHVTLDGAHWQDVTPPALPQWAQITSIEPSHVAKGAAYLTASRYMWDDFHSYVFETEDYGKSWTPLTAGLPIDQYAFVVRQDPSDPRLLFLGTKSAVFVSFDAGAQWQPLSLNLPPSQVRDIAIDTRQGAVAIATHGRAFWVLDNLTLLEQLANSPPANSGDLYLFAPQKAWLTHAYGTGAFLPLSAGPNPPFGATVFFNVPASYNGKTPVILSFADSQNATVASFTLHLRPSHPPPNLASSGRWQPTALRREEEFRLTEIGPGMNRFQWNLRYPDATEAKGFNPPIAAGGLPDEVDGPTVVPGRYTATLNYGGQTRQQSFDVELDPRLHASQAALAARLALGLRIHADLDTLDRTINAALDARDGLQHRLAAARDASPQGRAALSALDDEIGDVVQLQILSSEGTLLHETKLRSHLAYLAAEVELAYVRPTAAQYAVFEMLDARARSEEGKLRAETTAAEHLP